MAFTAGITRPQQTQGNSNQQQNTFDRLLTILNYDTSKGLLYGEDDKGNKYEVFVKQEEVLRADESIRKKGLDVSKSSYLGHRIDEKMKKLMPIGSKVTVSKSRVVEKDNGQGYKKTEVVRVGRVTEADPNKTYEATITVTYRMDDGKKKVARAQVWPQNGIDINNENALKELKEKMDEAASHTGQKMGEFNVTVPTYGIQFRTLMGTDRIYEVNKTKILEMVDSSIPFDWMQGPQDESGKEIKAQAHPIGGDEMLSIAEQYVEHISNHEAFKDHIENMRIEVVPYLVLPASNNDNMLLTTGDPEKDKHADKNPLYQMSHRVSFVDMENSDDGKIVGRNNAVKGIIQITGDRLEKVDGKPVEVPTNWVNRIHANNIRGHVHAFVRAEDGSKVEVNEALKLQPLPNQSNYQSNQNSNNNSGNAPSPAPVPAQREEARTPVAPAPVSTSDSADDFDPFSQDSAAPAPSPVASTPVAAPAPAKRFGFGQKNK